MRRSELEQLIRAAGRIAGERELVVIGSQTKHALLISEFCVPAYAVTTLTRAEKPS